MISALITLVVLAIVVSVFIWIVRYLEFPNIIEKVVIVLGVLYALLIILDGLGFSGGRRFVLVW